MASVLPRSEVTLLTEGVLVRLPDHAALQAAESSSSIGSEKGFPALERPPAVAKAEPEQKKPIFQFFRITPEYITTPLLVDGRNCLQPDAHSNGIHFGAWVARPMSEGPESQAALGLEPYFLSEPGNYLELYKGPKCSNGGSLPLPPLPPLPGGRPRAHP